MNIVNVMWDNDACVWFAICDLLGISLEDESYDMLLRKVIDAAPEMAEIKKVECESLVFVTLDRQYNYA